MACNATKGDLAMGRLVTLITLLMLHGVPVAADLHLDDGSLPPADLAVRQQLQQRLDQIAADPESYRKARYFGEMRSTLCKVWHGSDGNSVREGTPTLAGQDPVYIVDQFNRYADGRRRDYWMGSLVSGFTEEDKIKLAIYYAEQPMKPARGGDPALMARGKQLYETHCVDCHGADGRSEKGYARLAGQRPEYVAKMLREFRTPSGKRFSPVMYSRAFMLRNEQDVLAVATYLAHLE